MRKDWSLIGSDSIRTDQALDQPVDGDLLIGFCAVHRPYRLMAIKWQPAKCGANQLKAIGYGERPPA
jgi:hypothetical protein